MKFTICPKTALSAALAFCLCGVTEFALAATQETTEVPQYANSQPANAQVPETAQQVPKNDPRFGTTKPDPSQGPFETIPGRRPSPDLTNAPSAVRQEEEQSKPVLEAPATGPPVATQRSNGLPEPLGTATAERGSLRGGAASRPAGIAIAPAKQRQLRSLLIRMGAVAAGAVALGTVYGLARSSPSRPPAAQTGTQK